ncbi:hypothetical protein A6A28_32595 [Streptomyces sp. CB03578]|nr:hypothetical protein A6A28_32595 [Streptomyces sp. CB03578]
MRLMAPASARRIVRMTRSKSEAVDTERDRSMRMGRSGCVQVGAPHWWGRCSAAVSAVSILGSRVDLPTPPTLLSGGRSAKDRNRIGSQLAANHSAAMKDFAQ